MHEVFCQFISWTSWVKVWTIAEYHVKLWLIWKHFTTISLLLLTCTLFNIWHFFTGEGRGRFKASEIVSDPNRKDCYLATLTIADMISSDSRLYFVTIANDRGETRYGINARVCMNAQWVEKKFWWITYSNCFHKTQGHVFGKYRQSSAYTVL